MGVKSLILAYKLQCLKWSECGVPQFLFQGSIKRLAAFNLLRRERLRLHKLQALASKRSRKWWVRPIFLQRETYGAWFSLIPCLRETDEEGHFNFLRMTPDCFDWLLARVSFLITKTSNRKPISAGERLAVTLRYLTSGDSQVSLSYLFRISPKTITRIVLECTAAIWYAIKDDVFEPLSAEFWMRKAAEFEQMWQFTMCLGAVDGKHCFVQKFPMRGSEHYNYKFGNSVILFAVSDAKYKFIVVDVGARGRESDGGIFDRSAFGQMLQNHQLQIPPPVYNIDVQDCLPYVFLGDDAFPIGPHLMKGFDDSLQFKPEEIVFNYRVSRARRVVENAFGILSSRFRILRDNIIGSETLVQNVILATTALHNLHLTREDSIPPRSRLYLPEGYGDVFLSNGKFKKGRWRNENQAVQNNFFHKLAAQTQDESHVTNCGFEVREKFLELIIKRALPWQYDEL